MHFTCAALLGIFVTSAPSSAFYLPAGHVHTFSTQLKPLWSTKSNAEYQEQQQQLQKDDDIAEALSKAVDDRDQIIEKVLEAVADATGTAEHVDVPLPPSKDMLSELAVVAVEHGADPKAHNGQNPYYIALKAWSLQQGDNVRANEALKVTRGDDTHDFLEANPYYDTTAMPMNTYKTKAPHVGKVASVKRIVGPEAPGEICHIVIDHGRKFQYWEGQSLAVLPPGSDAKGKAHRPRLYSIASTRYGDHNMDGSSVTLCVRRATYWCPELGALDPSKMGVCSNYLCDATPGTEVKMTGPSGKVMLMPEEKPETDIIMVATGTGIAPYRSFWKRVFVEKTPAAKAYKGLMWLFLGVANSDALLYDDELKTITAANPDNFRVDYALSREQTNKNGGKMYIQDKVEEYSDEIFNRLDNGAHIYFCGLKGMMPGIQTMLEEVCKSKGLDYEGWLKGLKKNGQWHVEVY